MKFFILLYLLLSVSSCSLPKVGYYFGDWLIKREILSYVKFYSRQQERLETGLDDYMKWHRQIMLPRYGDALETVAAIAANSSLVEKDLMYVVSQGKTLFLQTFMPLTKIVSPLLAELSEQQIDRLRTTLAKKYRQRQGTEKRYRSEDIVVLWRENTKDWFGFVNEAQARWLEKNKDSLYRKSESRAAMARKGSKEKMFLDIFDEKDVKKRQKLFELYWQQFEQSFLQDQGHKPLVSKVASYLQLSNQKQKDFLVKRLKHFQNVIKSL